MTDQPEFTDEQKNLMRSAGVAFANPIGEEQTKQASASVARAMGRFWNKMAEVRETEAAEEAGRRKEREEIAQIMEEKALFYEEAAEESYRNDEPENAGFLNADAATLRDWAAKIRARSNPPTTQPVPVTQTVIPDDEIKF